MEYMVIFKTNVESSRWFYVFPPDPEPPDTAPPDTEPPDTEPPDAAHDSIEVTVDEVEPSYNNVSHPKQQDQMVF